MKLRFPLKKICLALILAGIYAPLFFSCLSWGATSAEEYYSLGMAYYELGKYAEAEKWFNRARLVDKTKIASEYNLGRIAFETGRYEEAARRFDRILQADGDNVLALKAAAYTRIKTGEFALAEALYARVLTLVPESADDGYNYALVLYALEKPEKAEEVLLKYQYRLDENGDALLLLARSQKVQHRIEAVNSYDRWLQNNNEDPRVRYEYAQVLEQGEYYARALEEYRKVLEGIPKAAGGSASEGADGAGTGEELTRSAVRYTIARLLLIADVESEEGITELRTAVREGFQDTAALETLLEDPAIPDPRKDDIRTIIVEIADAKEAAARAEAEKGGGDAPEEGASEASPGLEPEIPPEENRSAETGETPP
ncbi:MAG: tetratricopeptide repeat protein [Treponema sp.]|nr:tetratricopeptide repeat protein [Treponema sp.]